MSRKISCFGREGGRERGGLNIDQVRVPGNKLLWERESVCMCERDREGEREGLNIDQVHVPGNKLLWERERGRS